ncbi:MAG: lipopolysaccharide biosynthesis protein [Methylococcales bacterium]|nr:lipopolysaccharide biosynthesis protein [Methylococcales bacterium]
MMEEDTKSIQDYIQILRRHKNQMLLIALTVFSLASLVAFKMPSVYKSIATILIEQQEIPQELVRSTITSFADQRIQVISQRVMSSENLKAIIDKFNLYADMRKTSSLETLFENFRKDVQLEMVSADVVDPRSGHPTQATIAFTLAFNSTSPQLAQQVANELVSLYLNENLKRRNLAASEATDFLALESEKLRNRITALETDLAKFKEANANSLPELQELNMQLMDRTEQQMTDIDRQVNALNERKLYLEAELAQIQPVMSTFTSTGERIFGATDRLKALQAEYITLSARYAPTHPDVIKMEREINALQKEVGGTDKIELVYQITQKKGELAALSEHYAAGHPDIIKLQKAIAGLERELNKPEKSLLAANTTARPDNPAYIQLQAQLQSANADLNAIRASKAHLIAKLSEFEKSLRSAPQVERQYHELTRDYENATITYREVAAKQMEADMSQAMEKGSKGEHFSLIEPPLFPERPFKPNRTAIVFLGFIVALGAALGFVLIKASFDPSIYGSKALQAITGAPPLMVLPYIANSQDDSKKRRMQRNVLYGGLLAVLLAALLLHFLVVPLDVLWYTLLRKLGYNGATS